MAYLILVFENTKDTILMLSKKCSCYLNLLFFVFSIFFSTKKLGIKLVLCILFVPLVFRTKNSFHALILSKFSACYILYVFQNKEKMITKHVLLKTKNNFQKL